MYNRRQAGFPVLEEIDSGMIGETLGHYRIVELVGRGGMGEVYRAEDLRLGRTVALKVLPAELAGRRAARERLIREARAASKLTHPNIATIYEVNEARGRVYVSMEFVEGENLTQRLQHGAPSSDEVIDIGSQVAEALDAAHGSGIVHRDVKPENILVDPEGRVKVVDFGLAFELPDPVDTQALTSDSTRSARLTRSGTTVGTIAFMSPEQVRGETPDVRADLFSLGVVLYQMITRRIPFTGPTPLAMAAAIMHDPPAPFGEAGNAHPPALREITLRCLDKDPAGRPASALHIRDALRLVEQGHATGRIRRVLGRRVWRRRTVVGLGLAVLLLAAWAIGFWWSRIGEAETPARIAALEARRSYLQARSYEARGSTLHQLTLAERLFRRALEQEPGNPFLEGELARFLADFEFEYPGSEPGRRDEIERLSAQAIRADPDLAPAWVARARLLLIEGDPAGALEAARRAVELDRGSPVGRIVLGDALIDSGQVEAGLAELRRAVEEGEEHIASRGRLARQLLDQGKLDEAAAEYGRLLEYAPDSPTALNNLAAIHLARGNYVEAIQLLKRVLQVQPDDFAASNLGTAYFYLDRMDEAIDAFHEAVRLAPDEPLGKQNLAEAYEAAGDAENAAAWFADALQAYDAALPQVGEGLRPGILAERAFCAVKSGRPEEAVGNIEEALTAAPDDMFCLRAAARVHAIVGDRDRAFEFLGRAVAAGYPGEELRRDAAFEALQTDPEFLRLLTEPGS
jgi:tetratricopeptide (TPR) repeat protein/predicted Ser/Thr protein kinase